MGVSKSNPCLCPLPFRPDLRLLPLYPAFHMFNQRIHGLEREGRKEGRQGMKTGKEDRKGRQGRKTGKGRQGRKTGKEGREGKQGRQSRNTTAMWVPFTSATAMRLLVIRHRVENGKKCILTGWEFLRCAGSIQLLHGLWRSWKFFRGGI